MDVFLGLKKVFFNHSSKDVFEKSLYSFLILLMIFAFPSADFYNDSFFFWAINFFSLFHFFSIFVIWFFYSNRWQYFTLLLLIGLIMFLRFNYIMPLVFWSVFNLWLVVREKRIFSVVVIMIFSLNSYSLKMIDVNSCFKLSKIPWSIKSKSKSRLLLKDNLMIKGEKKYHYWGVYQSISSSGKSKYLLRRKITKKRYKYLLIDEDSMRTYVDTRSNKKELQFTKDLNSLSPNQDIAYLKHPSNGVAKISLGTDGKLNFIISPKSNHCRFSSDISLQGEVCPDVRSEDPCGVMSAADNKKTPKTDPVTSAEEN